MEEHLILKLHTSELRQPAGTDASSMDQQRPAFAVEEKESEFSTHEFTPSSSHTLGSEQHICELKHVTRDGLEPDLETSVPAPALAFTDESTASQSHSHGHDPTEQEAEQILKNEGFDQEELKQDHENRMTQRRYDLEEGTPAVVVTQPDEVSGDQNVLHNRNTSSCVLGPVYTWCQDVFWSIGSQVDEGDSFPFTPVF
ncbi:hypothetical protein PO909_021232 [Leuciscus waleckii]